MKPVRVTCPHRNKTYDANLPRGPWVCSACGARLAADDTSHRVERRK